jgi:hypothetical protein
MNSLELFAKLRMNEESVEVFFDMQFRSPEVQQS